MLRLVGMRGFLIMMSAVLLSIGVGVGVVAGVTTTPRSTVISSGCRSSASLVCVTAGDSGHRVQIRIGQRLTVTLNDAGLVWSTIREIGPPLLKQLGHPIVAGTFLKTSYAAVDAGQTALQASAAARCSAGQACPQFMLLWRVQLHVVR